MAFKSFNFVLQHTPPPTHLSTEVGRMEGRMKVWAAARDWDKNKPRTDFLVFPTTSPNTHTSLNPRKSCQVFRSAQPCSPHKPRTPAALSGLLQAQLTGIRGTRPRPFFTQAVKDHLPLNCSLGRPTHKILSCLGPLKSLLLPGPLYSLLS